MPIALPYPTPSTPAELFENLDALGLTDEVIKESIPRVQYTTVMGYDDGVEIRDLDQAKLDQTKLRATLSFPSLVELYNYLNDGSGIAKDIDDEISNENKARGYSSSMVLPALRKSRLLASFMAILDEFLIGALSEDFQKGVVTLEFYEAYFTDFLNSYATEITNFFTGYPAANNAVLKITNNFKANLKQASVRIINDWTNLQKVFVPQGFALAGLYKISSTGSDFHKGGKQVLILTFDLLPSNHRIRIIYKPSDIEADALLAGDSSIAPLIGRVQNQWTSLFEIINTWIRDNGDQNNLIELPTYKIYPVVYGSNLPYVNDPADPPQLQIRSSYGYIQFLPREDPDRQQGDVLYADGTGAYKLAPNANEQEICCNFFSMIGQLAAIVGTFSIEDLHIENLIATDFQPNLIDLEISLLREISSIYSTQFFTRSGHLSAVSGDQADTHYIRLRDTGADNNHIVEAQVHEVGQYEKNRLVHMNGRLVEPRAYSESIRGGLKRMLELFSTKRVNSPPLSDWFARVENLIVRYLPKPTQYFADRVKQIYGRREGAGADDQYHLQDGDYYQTVAQNDFTTEYGAYPNPTPVPAPPPNFAALYSDYTSLDYQNCDVPIYYHRIGTQNVMSSLGVEVQLPRSNPPADNTAKGPAAFFPCQTTIGDEDFNFPEEYPTMAPRTQFSELATGVKLATRYTLIWREIRDSLGLGTPNTLL